MSYITEAVCQLNLVSQECGRQEKVIFGGRLGEYKYYDMDAVIASALDMCERELQ